MAVEPIHYPPERPVTDLPYGGRLGKTVNFPLFKWFGETRIGPIYLGGWGLLSFATGGMFTFIWLVTMLQQVAYNPIAYLKYFFVLQLDPPPPAYGRSLLVPLNEGGWWLLATFFLTVAILTWFMRVWTRAQAFGLRPYLAYGFSGAIVLYLVIYIIRPVVMGDWSEAPAHGLKALLDWTNNVSVRYGNFYYNPFHMLSIFFLLGSTLLLSMHGATILGAQKYLAEEELDEIVAPGTGTERAQLFWRWCMGFNANAYSIHVWAFWFAWLCGFTGAVGLLLSGTLVNDWFSWAEAAGITWPGAGSTQGILPPYGQLPPTP